MITLYVLIPLALLLVGMAVAAFFWAVGHGQFDDLDTPPWRALLDDDHHPDGREEPPKKPMSRAAGGTPRRSLVCRATQTCPQGSTSASKARRRSIFFTVIPGLLVAITPKCPFCWAAYMGMFGSIGVSIPVSYQPWFLPALSALLLLNIGAMFLRARAQGRFAPFLLCLAGGLTVVIGKLAFDSGHAVMAGLACVVIGSIWNAVAPGRT